MTFWTEDRTEKLRHLVREGKSASAAAKELGTTRNAAIGKAIRQGLRFGGVRWPKRGTSLSREDRLAAERVRNALRRPHVVSRPEPKPTVPVPATVATLKAGPNSGVVAKAVLGLEPHHCKFPIGETTSPDFRFCGEPHLTSGMYCETHANIAYQRQAKKDWRVSRRAWAESNRHLALARRVLRELDAEMVGA
jgi:GcrA cell cycle regulator